MVWKLIYLLLLFSMNVSIDPCPESFMPGSEILLGIQWFLRLVTYVPSLHTVPTAEKMPGWHVPSLLHRLHRNGDTDIQGPRDVWIPYPSGMAGTMCFSLVFFMVILIYNVV